MIEDVTAKKQSEQLIWQQANFDTLTQLPNRRMFLDRLGTTCSRASATSAHCHPVHRPRPLQGSQRHAGPPAGRCAAGGCGAPHQRLRAQVGHGGAAGRRRIHRDPVELDESEEVERIAQDIIDRLLQPFELGQEQAFVSASIGITLYPDDALDIDSLLKHADQAMYAAKGAGRNRYSYFTPTLQVAALSACA
jgi:GGDEF domain-containing protein